jgi:hypothetical protein
MSSLVLVFSSILGCKKLLVLLSYQIGAKKEPNKEEGRRLGQIVLWFVSGVCLLMAGGANANLLELRYLKM